MTLIRTHGRPSVDTMLRIDDCAACNGLYFRKIEN